MSVQRSQLSSNTKYVYVFEYIVEVWIKATEPMQAEKTWFNALQNNNKSALLVPSKSPEILILMHIFISNLIIMGNNLQWAFVALIFFKCFPHQSNEARVVFNKQ